MTNKIGIVTGANKGLGFAIVKGLCEENYKTVYLTSRNVKYGRDACQKLQELGLHPFYQQLDITEQHSISRFISYIQKSHKKIDLIVNNAGVLFLKNSTEPRLKQVTETMSVNLFSLINFCESMLPLINDGGTIVNISSSSGHLSRIPSEELRKEISSPDLTLDDLKKLMNSYIEDVKLKKDLDKWGDSPYVVSKVGVNAYTFILHRKLLTRGIKVNCVHPGYVMSDMTRGAGSITPEQAARIPLQLSIQPRGSGLYVWHDGTVVPWDGPDPRGYIDGKAL